MLTGSLDTPSTNARPSQSNFEARAAHYSAIYNYYPKKNKGTWQMPMHLISSQSAITLEPLIVRRIYKCPAGREIEMGTIDVAS